MAFILVRNGERAVCVGEAAAGAFFRRVSSRALDLIQFRRQKTRRRCPLQLKCSNAACLRRLRRTPRVSSISVRGEIIEPR